MAKIVIKDLTESIDLDRQAMLTITGGARVRGRQSIPSRVITRSSTRLFSYPTGSMPGQTPAPAGSVAPGTKSK